MRWTDWAIVIATVLMIGWLMYDNPVKAQNLSDVCGPKAKVVERLKAEFGEIPAAAGITALGNLLELYLSDKGSWTIIANMPKGYACTTLTGDGWIWKDPALQRAMSEKGALCALILTHNPRSGFRFVKNKNMVLSLCWRSRKRRRQKQKRRFSELRLAFAVNSSFRTQKEASSF